MKKHLKLSLDDLQVESFLTTSLPAEPGTVYGHISGSDCGECATDPDTQGICTGDESCLALCSAYCPQPTANCTVVYLTCPPHTQQDTCADTCGCASAYCTNNCSAYSCYPCTETREFMTQCWD